MGYISKARALQGVVKLNEESKMLVVGGQVNCNTYVDDAEIIEAKN